MNEFKMKFMEEAEKFTFVQIEDLSRKQICPTFLDFNFQPT